MNTSTTAPTPPNGTHSAPRHEPFFIELLKIALIALVIVVPIRVFIAQPFIVSGASMEHAFSDGEYLIVDQLTYRFEEPVRGDVVVFKYPNDERIFFIKRIVGLPGETVSITDTAVRISTSAQPQGRVLEEPYVSSMSPHAPITLSLREGEYFVMGDNRDASSDSRTWGALSEELIVGRAYIRLLPVAEAALLPGAYHIE